jgi:hypothetical protein
MPSGYAPNPTYYTGVGAKNGALTGNNTGQKDTYSPGGDYKTPGGQTDTNYNHPYSGNDGNQTSQYGKTLQPGAFVAPSTASGNIQTPGGAFDDPNAAAIYNMVGGQMGNALSQQAPIANNTRLGPAAQYGGAQIAPQMMLSGAQMSPAMMTSGAQLGTAQDMQYAGAQNQQINALAAMAAGQGPSVATTQAQQLAQQNIAQQMAALGSQRGAGSAALGQRAAAEQAATANQAAAAQGALGRSQEALAAQSQLTGALQGARGQSQATAQAQAQLAQQADLANQSQYNQFAQGQAQLNQQAGLANQQTSAAASTANAQLAEQTGLANQGALNQFGLQQGQMNQQTALANQQAQMGEQQLSDQEYNAMLQAYMQQNQTDISNSAAYQQMMTNAVMQQYGVDKGVAINTANNMMGLGGAGISALGSGIAAAASPSDIRLKRSVRPAGRGLGDFLAALGAV